jgi:positive regulator of sigma E activity
VKQRRTSPGRLLAIGSVVLVLLLGYLFVDRYRQGQARQEACQAETVQDGVQPGSLAFDTAVAECVDSG